MVICHTHVKLPEGIQYYIFLSFGQPICLGWGGSTCWAHKPSPANLPIWVQEHGNRVPKYLYIPLLIDFHPFFDANIRCFAGSSFFCLGTTPYAMAAQPFMVTIHQYPHFLLVVPPIKNPTISWQMALFHPVSPSASGFDLGKLPLPTHVAAIPMCWWTYIPRFCCGHKPRMASMMKPKPNNVWFTLW